jgi:two-component system, cell cycle sensor histidine kinase and response regulator CckA
VFAALSKNLEPAGVFMKDDTLSREKLLEEVALLRSQVEELEQRCARLEQAQGSHQERDDHCRTIMDNLAVGAFISSLDGEFLHANPTLVKMAGYDNSKDFLSTPTARFYATSSDRDTILDELHRKGAVHKKEIRALTKSGEVNWISLSAVLDRHSDAKLARIVGTVEDINDRKGRDERLRESEERFRVAFETSPDSMAIVREHDGLYVAVNEGFLAMHGYSEDEIVGRSSLDLKVWCDPEDRSTLRRILKRDGYVKNLQVQFHAKDGSIRTCLMSARIITLQGEPHILSATRDIGEWKRTKEVLQETEKRFVRLLEDTDTGLLVVDGSGRVINSNHHYARMAGAQSPDELIGRSVLEWTAPECIEENAAAVARCVREGSVSDFKTVYLRPDGSRARILVNAMREDGDQGSYITTLCRDITATQAAADERRVAQKKIQEQNEFLTTIIESLPDPFYVVDAASHRVLMANSAAVAAGLSPGATCHSVWHGTAEPCPGLTFQCPVQRVTQTGRPYTVEHTHGGPDGESRIVQIQAYPIVDSVGQITSVIGYAVDITDQRKAQERFLESEERFKKFADEVSFEGVIIHDKGKILYVNPVFGRMYGYDPAELIGADHSITLAEESRELVSRNIREGIEQPYEAMGRKKDGTVFPTEIHGKSIPFAGGTVRVAATRDLTNAKQAERALRESESRFRSLFEAATEFIEILDESGHILEANPAFLKGTGWTYDQVMGKRVDEFFSPASKELFERYFPTILNVGVCSTEIELVASDGKIINVDCTASSIRGGNGNTKYVVVAQRDITEHKRLEEQLRQAVKMEAIGRLAGGVAHDFNNLLTAIMGYCAMLMQRLPEEGDHVQKLAQINLASERAAALTQQLLAFSRKQVLRMRVIDINIVISDIGEMLRRLIGENIDLVMFLHADLPTVRADHGQIEQILVNLVVNARDAMPHGGRLTVETAPVTLDDDYVKFHLDAGAGSYVALSISDNGIGMDSETRSRIFEPFYTTKGKGFGTGLGLSTVYGIVRQHGGHISVYSEPGVGTTFKVYLPCVQEAPEEVLAPELTMQPSHGAETILVVEDEEIVRNMATEFLQMLGYTVLSIGHPDEALETCATHPGTIDLLLTDVILPKMDGRTLARNILKKRPHVKVLYVSGYTENAIVHHGVLDPGIHFLQKPFGMDALARKVREVLDAPDAEG